MMPNGKLICTKPGNARRFSHPCNRAIETTLAWPVLLLYIPEVAAVAEKARSVGELEYNPGFDIDRFALKCTWLDVEPESCPAFKKLLELLEAHVFDGRNLDPSFVSVEVEKDLLDGKVHVTRVCHGDGTCGPVAEYNEDGLEAWKELRTACAECDKHAEKRPGDADDGNDKLVHGGIIAFFKRLIGRLK